MLDRYLNRRLALPPAESKLWKAYMETSFSLPESTEKAFHKLFMFPCITAYHSLEEEFPGNIKMNVHFFTGAYDWLD
jgi:hypothetical protein